ncbi:MAG: hypothetical protein KF842_10345 [Caulobacter sp.]|nr:hypothetical protein [Caulobacter sp.]
MRLPLVSAVVMTATVLATTTAMAAPTTLLGDFQSICAANRNSLPGQVAAARAAGYSPSRTVDGVMGFEKTVDGRGWALAIKTGEKPAAGATPGQTFVTCTVVGIDDAGVVASGLANWVGGPAHTATADKTLYYYKQRNGNRTMLSFRREADMVEALRSGGYDVASYSRQGAYTTLILTTVLPKP